MRRARMSRRTSKKAFRKGASRVHGMNNMASSGSRFVMRGGIRL